MGIASDSRDRRWVLVVTAAFALIADGFFLSGLTTDAVFVLVASALFGAAVYSMYPVIVAHANDHAAPGTFIQVSGGLLLVYGIGSIVGPTAAGFAMSTFGPSSLFATTAVAHVLLIAFAVLRILTAPAAAQEEKGSFQAAPLARMSTPETAALAADEVELAADRAGAEADTGPE